MRWWGGNGQPWVPCLKIVDLPSLGNLVNLVNLNTVQRDATRKPLLHLGQALVLLRQLLLHHHVLLVVYRPGNQLLPVLSSHVSLQLLRQGETLQAHLASVSGKFLLDRENVGNVTSSPGQRMGMAGFEPLCSGATRVCLELSLLQFLVLHIHQETLSELSPP